MGVGVGWEQAGTRMGDGRLLGRVISIKAPREYSICMVMVWFWLVRGKISVRVTRRLSRQRGKGNMARDGHAALGPRGEKEHGQVHTGGLSVVEGLEGEVDVRIGPSKCDAPGNTRL